MKQENLQEKPSSMVESKLSRRSHI